MDHPGPSELPLSVHVRKGMGAGRWHLAGALAQREGGQLQDGAQHTHAGSHNSMGHGQWTSVEL